MNYLVIDTATDRSSLALFSNNELIYSGFHDGATEHAEALPKLLKECLSVESRVDQVVVGMGPGPYTGLRVGIIFAMSFANARQIPWIGVCSLDGIDIDSDSYLVATDARRKEIYFARYQDGIRTQGPSVSAPSEIKDLDIATSKDHAITVIEWGEGLVNRLSDEYLVIDIAFGTDENERLLSATSIGPRWAGFSL